MRRLRASVARVARFPSAILLTGETGTGKGVVARELHEVSSRRNQPFVHVDCAGLVDGLLEAELYGVAKGAFTGAQFGRLGRFETAREGTLFLDEIGELSTSGQAKLLRILEERTFERVGETKTRRLGARVIAATHVDLEAAVARGKFRSDLYFRLCVLRLDVPPLREQSEDLPRWITLAIERAAKRLDSPPLRFSTAALDRLCDHAWPGNLRELFHVVEAATVLCESGFAGVELVAEILGPVQRPTTSERELETSKAENSSMAAAERELTRAKGNLSLAARRLGIPRSTLRYRLGLDDAISRGRRLRAGHSRSDAARRV